MKKLNSKRISEAVTLLSLIALCFPSIGMIRLDSGIIFPHYFTLALTIPVLLLNRPVAPVTVLPVIALIFLSSLINLNTADLKIAGFHIMHLIAAGLLSGCSRSLGLGFAKITLIIYAVTILVTQLFAAIGIGGIFEELFTVQKESLNSTRVSAFATEPSYAGLIMLIMSRFVIVTDIKWFNWKRLGLIITGLLASLSLFSLISVAMIMAMYLYQRGKERSSLGLLTVTILLLVTTYFTDYFEIRLNSLDLSAGVQGLRSGTIRILPYFYIIEILPNNMWPIFVGAGAGMLEPEFFINLGQFYTMNNSLPTHMAASIYDYGLPSILVILFLWNRPNKITERVLFLLMAILMMTNTGMGTYLFVIFGIYALLEQRLRTTPLAQTERNSFLP